MTRYVIPGIFLKANLFGDGERENNKDCSDSNGKLAVGVPVGTDCTFCVVSHSSYHCNRKVGFRTRNI